MRFIANAKVGNNGSSEFITLITDNLVNWKMRFIATAKMGINGSSEFIILITDLI